MNRHLGLSAGAVMALVLITGCSDRAEQDASISVGSERGDTSASSDSAPPDSRGSGPSREPKESTTEAEPTLADRSDEEAALQTYVTRKADCLTEAGFPSTVRSDGGIQIDGVPPEQQQAFVEADTSCAEQLGSIPGEAPFTTPELSVLYDLHVEGRDCLEDQGLAVSDPPSRQTWIAQYEAGLSGADEAPWSPWSEASDPATAIEVCPEPSGQDVYERMADN